MPKELRANLISIGIWVLKEADAIRLGRVESITQASLTSAGSSATD